MCPQLTGATQNGAGSTYLTHLLPEIPGASDCLRRSVLFCEDCRAFRVRGQRAIYGRRDEAVRYALAMLACLPAMTIITDDTRCRES